MRRRIIAFLSIALILFLLVSCIKDNNSNKDNKSNDDLNPVGDNAQQEVPTNIDDIKENESNTNQGSNPNSASNLNRKPSNANMINYTDGHYAWNNGWIYYDIDVQDNSGLPKLFKMKEDGTEYIKVLDDYVLQLVIEDEWIYYRTLQNPKYVAWDDSWEGDEAIFKIRTDGTGKTLLYEGESYLLGYNEESIFIREDSKEYDSLSRVDIDGSELTELKLNNCLYPNIIDEYIYFFSYKNGHTINRMNTDGTNHMMIFEMGEKIKGCRVNRMVVYEEKIYLLIDDYSSSYLDNEGIYILNNDGTGFNRIINDNVYGMFTISKNFIFYVTIEETDEKYPEHPETILTRYILNSYNMDTKENQSLFETPSSYVAAINEWVFYYRGDNLYKLNVDTWEEETIRK